MDTGLGDTKGWINVHAYRLFFSLLILLPSQLSSVFFIHACYIKKPVEPKCLDNMGASYLVVPKGQVSIVS